MQIMFIDEQGIFDRVSYLQTRSLKGKTKLDFLRLAISMIDLTTLEGQDTPSKVKQLALKGRFPHPTLSVPQVAALCVYPTLVKMAKTFLKNTEIKVASVATGFPAGQLPFHLRLAEVEYAIEEGADEIDMVINRNAFHSGNYKKVSQEIESIKMTCGDAVHLKVILETGELGTFDKIRRASWLAMEAGADFIKTSTGKISPAATLTTTLVMLEAIRDFFDKTGKKIGMKPAGGISTAKTALHYLVLVKETLGEIWLTKDLFRIGASRLLNDLLRQVAKQETGIYQNIDYFSID